jgi:hypothetical protein
MNKLTDLLKREFVEQLEQGEGVDFVVDENISGWLFIEDGKIGICLNSKINDKIDDKIDLIKRIHPLDLGELINSLPITTDIYQSRGITGENIIEIPKYGLSFIQDHTVPRKTFDIE